jgi:hypothetical protein
MMKKLSLLVVILVVFQLFQVGFAQKPADTKFSLTLGAGARNFSESRFKDVYDKTPIIYSVDIAWKFWKSMEVFLHSDILSVDGKLTYTQEDTTFKTTPLELGFRYLVTTKKSENARIFPYLGAGAGYYMVKEENVISNLDENRLGFFVEGGLRFYVTGSIFVDAKLKNIFLKSGNEDGTNMGGLAYMGGIGFSW